MPKEKNQLHSVELDEVSVVDNGANVLAKVVLMKRADQEEGVDKAAPAGIQFNIGFPPEGSDGGSEVQSVIFDSKLWDAERAKKWLKDHDMVSEKVDETENTLRFRQKDPADFKRFRVITPGKAVSKALKARDSFQRVSSVVEQTVRDEFGVKPENGLPATGPWIRDLFKDSTIFDQDGQTYRVDYSVDRDENSGELKVTLGEKVPVEVVYQDVKKSDEPPPVVDELPDIPEELKHRVLKMRMDVLQARLRKSNSCHVPSGPAGGQFCEGGGKGSGSGGGAGSGEVKLGEFTRIKTGKLDKETEAFAMRRGNYSNPAQLYKYTKEVHHDPVSGTYIMSLKPGTSLGGDRHVYNREAGISVGSDRTIAEIPKYLPNAIAAGRKLQGVKDRSEIPAAGVSFRTAVDALKGW
jgi:hypothetical protein